MPMIPKTLVANRWPPRLGYWQCACGNGESNRTPPDALGEDENVPGRKVRDDGGEIRDEELNEEDALLPELDGQLRWPDKRRRH
jgi:hypothetical protein